MRLTIVLTARCNASCTHCSTTCGPRRLDSLTEAEIVRLIDETVAVADETDPRIDLTGGEPFLNFEMLLRVVSHARERGAEVTCVSNAYWAKTLEETEDKIYRLKNAGLMLLAISTSRFHQEFVPLRRVRRALESAARIGLCTELKVAVTQDDLIVEGRLSQWREQLDANRISVFPVLNQLRDGGALPDTDYYRQPGLPLEVCPDEQLCVQPNGSVSSCCSMSPPDGFLKIGHIQENSVLELKDRLQGNAKQRLLRESGPIWFALKAVAAGAGHRLRTAYAGPCDLCLHIAQDPILRRIADDHCAALD